MKDLATDRWLAARRPKKGPAAGISWKMESKDLEKFIRNLDKARDADVIKEFRNLQRQTARKVIVPEVKRIIPRSALRKPHIVATTRVTVPSIKWSERLSVVRVKVGNKRLFYGRILDFKKGQPAYQWRMRTMRAVGSEYVKILDDVARKMVAKILRGV